MSDLPIPPVPADADLRDFPFTPIFRARLFGSSFHARSSDAEWRVGVTLWLKSWDQVPAGSLPDDDIELCRLAELGRDLKSWEKVRAGAMRGWYPCSDGLLYHAVVADGVNDAIKRKLEQRAKTLSARVAALKKRLSEATEEDVKLRITDEIKRMSLTLSQTRISAESKQLTDHVTDSVTDPVTESKRREEKRRDRDRDKENLNTFTPKSNLKKLLDLGVDEQIAKDWLAVRKAKRAPLTDTALEEMKLEAGKAGISLPKAVAICAKRSWQGFKASWNWREEPDHPDERRAVI